MWQHAVADQDAESSVIEKLPVHAGNAVDDSGKTKCIVRPTPLLALKRDPRSDGPVDIGNLKWFDIAVSGPGAREHAELLCDLLFEINAHAGAALVFAHCRYIGRPACDLR